MIEFLSGDVVALVVSCSNRDLEVDAATGLNAVVVVVVVVVFEPSDDFDRSSCIVCTDTGTCMS